jgi:hypothetical protein
MVKKAVRRNQGGGLDDFLRNGEAVAGFNNLPTGVYDGHIKPGSALLEVKQGGGERVTMFLIVDSGEFEGREQRKRDDLTSQFGVNLFLGDLKAMELGEPKTKREFAEALAETDGLKVKFWVSEPKDEFPPKVRINELLEGQEVSQTATEAIEAAAASYSLSKRDVVKLGKDEDKKGLQKIIDDEALDIDQDKYVTYEEVANLIIKELDL